MEIEFADLQRQKVFALIRDCEGTDFTTASRACGKNHSYFHQFIHRRVPRKLPEDIRYALAQHLGVDEAELRPDSKMSSPSQQLSVSVPTFVTIRAIDEGAEQTSSHHLRQFDRGWVRHVLNAEPEDLRGHIVGDNAMAPSLVAGDTVLIDTNRTAPSPGGLFAIHDGVGVIVRRLEAILNSEPARLRIHAENERYQKHDQCLSETTIFGRVVWFARAI